MSGTTEPVYLLPVASTSAPTDLFLTTVVSGADLPQRNQLRLTVAMGMLEEFASGNAGPVVLPGNAVNILDAVPYQQLIAYSFPFSGGALTGLIGFSNQQGVTVTGTTQATGYPIVSQLTVIGTCSVSGTARLPSGLGAGYPLTILNRAVNDGLIAPPIGGQIEGYGVNVRVPIAAGTGGATLWSRGSNNWYIQ